MKTLGIVLLVVGLIMTVFTGFNLITQEKVVDLGSVEINKKEKTPIFWSPITGGILAAAGLVVILVAKRK
jgi:drug/metabolite transporter (DMT)-like permease